ncbi:hypothetical protein D3C73_1142410 [compost metagenome]
MLKGFDHQCPYSVSKNGSRTVQIKGSYRILIDDPQSIKRKQAYDVNDIYAKRDAYFAIPALYQFLSPPDNAQSGCACIGNSDSFAGNMKPSA